MALNHACLPVPAPAQSKWYYNQQLPLVKKKYSAKIKRSYRNKENGMRIVVDAMGSDTYPDPEIEAAVNASKGFNGEIILVGNSDSITPKLKLLRR
jgi:phosphomannomutase